MATRKEVSLLQAESLRERVAVVDAVERIKGIGKFKRRRRWTQGDLASLALELGYAIKKQTFGVVFREADIPYNMPDGKSTATGYLSSDIIAALPSLAMYRAELDKTIAQVTAPIPKAQSDFSNDEVIMSIQRRPSHTGMVQPKPGIDEV